MPIRRGANLLELLPTAVAGLVPDEIVERLGFLTVIDHHASIAPGITVHTGSRTTALSGTGGRSSRPDDARRTQRWRHCSAS